MKNRKGDIKTCQYFYIRSVSKMKQKQHKTLKKTKEMKLSFVSPSKEYLMPFEIKHIGNSNKGVNQSQVQNNSQIID